MAMISIRKARQTNDPFVIYFYFCLVGEISSFPFFLLGFKIPNAHQWILLIWVSLILFGGQILMNQGFKFCKASEGSLILMSEIVFAGMAGVMIFNDPITLNLLVGAFLIVGSGVGLNLIYRRPSKLRSVA